jgi:pilus assembly protein CpaB
VGETITGSLIRTALGDVRRNGAVATPGEVVGKVATRPIPAGAMIERSMYDAHTKLAIRVPVGMRAVSIDTTAEIAVAGLIRPGDRVDVQTVYPGQDAINGVRGAFGVAGRSHAKTLLEMVPVLAVGELVLGSTTSKPTNPGSDNALTSAARTVTLALTPQQVLTLSLAKHVGALSLALRNPDDNALGAAGAQANDDQPARAPVRFAARAPHRHIRTAPASNVQIVIAGRNYAAAQ